MHGEDPGEASSMEINIKGNIKIFLPHSRGRRRVFDLDIAGIVQVLPCSVVGGCGSVMFIVIGTFWTAREVSVINPECP